jgi:hypothetical protein
MNKSVLNWTQVCQLQCKKKLHKTYCLTSTKVAMASKHSLLRDLVENFANVNQPLIWFHTIGFFCE